MGAAGIVAYMPSALSTLESDEYRLTIEEGSIGIELEDIEMYRQTGKRVRVKRLVPGGQAEMAGTVSVGDVLLSATGVSIAVCRSIGDASLCGSLLVMRAIRSTAESVRLAAATRPRVRWVSARDTSNPDMSASILRSAR